MICVLIITASLLVQAGPATPQWQVGPTPTPVPIRAPVAVVERLYHDRGSLRRVTLFSDRMAVVSVCDGDERVFYRRLTLDGGVYIAYLAALQRDALRLPPDQGGLEEGVLPRGVITLRAGGVSRTVEYSPLRVQNLGVASLVATVDDLEQTVSAVSPSHEEMQRWQPKPGDLVLLWSGGRARVREVEAGGVVILVHEDVAIIEEVPPAEWGQRIQRVLEAAP